MENVYQDNSILVNVTLRLVDIAPGDWVMPWQEAVRSLFSVLWSCLGPSWEDFVNPWGVSDIVLLTTVTLLLLPRSCPSQRRFSPPWLMGENSEKWQQCWSKASECKEAKQANLFKNTLGIKHKRATELIWAPHPGVGSRVFLPPLSPIGFKIPLSDRRGFKVPLLHWCDFSQNLLDHLVQCQDCWLCPVGEINSPSPSLLLP